MHYNAKTRPKKQNKTNGFYHENVKPKKLKNLHSKKKNSTIRYT